MSILRGMGLFQPGPDSSDACGGATPCGATDWISMSSACAQFLVCADPSFVQTVSTLAQNPGALQPLIVAPLLTAPAVGYAAGEIAAVAVPVAGRIVSGAVGGAATATGIPITVIYLGLGVAAFFLLKSVIK